VFGGSLVIHEGEIVHTVTVTGGSLKVEGTVTGDLVVAGGSAKVVTGGRVIGNATVFGGSLKIEKDGRIDGDVGIVGGALKREDGAIIGGRIVDEDDDADVEVRAGAHDTSAEVNEDGASSGRSRLSQAAQAFGQSLTKMALLFVLGCVLLALVASPMEKVRVEIASRPMRSFALGLVGTLVGSIGAIILLTILCVTVIGIPVAVLAVVFAAMALYGAVASALTTFGAAVAGHKTQNPYIHLLVGCAAFLVVSSLPWVGVAVTFVVTMIAIGALITTRVGGLLTRGRRPPSTGLV
jgi:cytoskeletal protein CcmA (bactofilin family)